MPVIQIGFGRDFAADIFFLTLEGLLLLVQIIQFQPQIF
ncbi:MAG: hypothetical protein KatS3mg031_0624 [Chitinophagales bacterium]|nr:MAG: hypothetical protein KatS3mg031_0624 [Chitinophagales bacterium]